MAFDKLVDSVKLDGAITATANAIREKTETTEKIAWNPETGFSDAIEAIEVGGSGGSSSVSKKDVNFYDYDGTLLHSYTVAEAQALTELPELPEREGLICQGWNYDLETIKEHNRAVNVGATYTTDDGTTRIYIHLEDGRTSPMLGVCPNGTVTVDWGDGTTPDTLTGASITSVKWTPNHEYAEPGDYVIKLTVDGTMGLSGSSATNDYSYILRHNSSADGRNAVYQTSVKKVEFGDSVTSIGMNAFDNCHSLASVVIPDSVTSIDSKVFQNCYSLASVVIPDSVTSIGMNAFYYCNALASVVIPDSVTSIGNYAFDSCSPLASVVIPDSVTSIGNYAFQNCNALASVVISDSVTSISLSAFYKCYSLASVVIPDSVTSISMNAFCNCYSLASVVIPDSVTSISVNAFQNCYSLASVVIPDSVTSIGSKVFQNCGSVKYYDFTKHTAVPTLSNINAFDGIAADCEIRVPAALYDEWIAATNWATYASQIVAV